MPNWYSNLLIVSVYLYLAVFLCFFLYYQDVARNQSVSFFHELHASNADTWRRVVFMVILATFLGTPLTSGFFYKVLVFNTLTTSSNFIVMAAIILNLIMLIFYLQASRLSQVARKKKVRRLPQDTNTASKGALALMVLATACSIFIFAALLDILVAILS